MPRNNLNPTALNIYEGSDEQCCGICKSMDYEDTDGYGYCYHHHIPCHCSEACSDFVNR